MTSSKILVPFRLLSGLGIATALLAGPALSDPLAPGISNCATLNCNALVLPGRINGHPESPMLASPWVGKIAAAGPHCLRIQVATQTADLAMTVVGPDGTVFTSDNIGSGSCPTCPKVVIRAPRNGVHTIILNSRTGTAVEASFEIRAGRYPAASVNCAAPTPGA